MVMPGTGEGGSVSVRDFNKKTSKQTKVCYLIFQSFPAKFLKDCAMRLNSMWLLQRKPVKLVAREKGKTPGRREPEPQKRYNGQDGTELRH